MLLDKNNLTRSQCFLLWGEGTFHVSFITPIQSSTEYSQIFYPGLLEQKASLPWLEICRALQTNVTFFFLFKSCFFKIYCCRNTYERRHLPQSWCTIQRWAHNKGTEIIQWPNMHIILSLFCPYSKKITFLLNCLYMADESNYSTNLHPFILSNIFLKRLVSQYLWMPKKTFNIWVFHDI